MGWKLSRHSGINTPEQPLLARERKWKTKSEIVMFSAILRLTSSLSLGATSDVIAESRLQFDLGYDQPPTPDPSLYESGFDHGSIPPSGWRY